MKAGQQVATFWNSGQKVWTTARSWMKGWGASGASSGEIEASSGSEEKTLDKESVGLPVDAPPPPLPEDGDGHHHEAQEDGDEEGDGEPQKRKSLWGPCECCISCVSAPCRARIELQADRPVGNRIFQP
jgi:hypothetical protein